VKRALLAMLGLLCLAVGAAISPAPQVRLTAQPEARQVVFGAFEVFVDSGDEPLAAYQVEIKDMLGRARIVGIEGGVEPYTLAPHYDPRAMQREHVIIGAFSTSDKLPRGRVRVARLHIMSEGGEPEFQVVLTTAGAPGGRKINANVTLEAKVQGDGQ
jgi:hypothetical protein